MTIDGLIGKNHEYADTRHQPVASKYPRERVAVVTCMDSRIDPQRLLGTEPGDIHVLRNAGGLITDDMVRSLAISQRRLGTTAIAVIQHTDCGMLALDDTELADEIEAESGQRPPFPFLGFHNQEEQLVRSLGVLRGSPFLRHRDAIRGFIWDVHSGRLHEVTPEQTIEKPATAVAGPDIDGPLAL
ncbi:MAG: beta-class carbonic anhydrase [Candidatus Dormibacteria bacterium]